MKLKKLLTEKKAAISKKWFQLVIDTYPVETSKFLKSQKDPFANPVGRTTLKGLEAILDELIQGMDFESVTSFLDPIIRIRAIQDFTPSEATGFILSLKTIIRDLFDRELEEKELLKEFLEFERKIDELSLFAFDIYMQCREKLNQLKSHEQRNTMFKALERAGLVSEIPDKKPDLNESDSI